MPRKARVISNTGIYHIMTRGINKEQIFKKEINKVKILEIIKILKEDVQFDAIAYCIMDNHIHLLIKAEENELRTLMKKLNVKYAMHYNSAEKRNGHVFQDRFRSEAVEDDKYMLGAIRYIHNNPVKVGIVKNVLEYQWSSAKDYINQKSEIISYKYLNEVMDLFKNNDEFIAFHDINDNNIYIDTKEEKDENIQNIVRNVIEKYVNENYLIDQKQITQQQREELAEKLLSLNLITYREIAELCNLTVHRVSEIKNNKEI
ncbi:REP element-mobilizing transposase RayT [Sedimentibacter acidaminivorans]|uniref:REP element-mobilizing transposase RayT n=1 Tax=Sedimentibacter acidaminivorans TaxID=913099 RepID=A0ABS4GA30_9FIRM|nr:transposase [Sedimentibacter acidaminivorans]MBP1924539.1 REP element-mobilizing transposase RayT [Sedimentibacter acidaminivorans]